MCVCACVCVWCVRACVCVRAFVCVALTFSRTFGLFINYLGEVFAHAR